MTLFERVEIACEMARLGSKEPAQTLLEMCQQAIERNHCLLPGEHDHLRACAIELEMALEEFEPQYEPVRWDSMVRFDEFTR